MNYDVLTCVLSIPSFKIQCTPKKKLMLICYRFSFRSSICDILLTNRVNLVRYFKSGLKFELKLHFVTLNRQKLGQSRERQHTRLRCNQSNRSRKDLRTDYKVP